LGVSETDENLVRGQKKIWNARSLRLNRARVRPVLPDPMSERRVSKKETDNKGK